MMAYARLRPGPGFQLRHAVFYYAQRVVTPRAARRAVASCLAAAIRLRQGQNPKDFAQPAVRDAVATLKRNGLAKLENFLAPATIKSIVTFLGEQELVGPDGRSVRLQDLPLGTGMAAYPLDAVMACPGLLQAINAPEILQIASDYLGCKPTISSLGIRWSFPSAARLQQTQTFHRDPDDWRFIKLFVYLTDVDADAGPHVYVAGSHNTAATFRGSSPSRAALESRFGPESMTTVVGPRGTTFVADTYGFHAGMPPLLTPRLILQVQYSILPIFAFRYHPITPAIGLALDPYVNRLLLC